MMQNENKFTREELHFVLNSMATLGLNSEEKDCVGRKLSEKKAKGIPINDQAMAIAISECKKVKNEEINFSISPANRKTVG